MESILEICAKRTALTTEEAVQLGGLARNLQLIADVSQSDVFIDCLTTDASCAVVVAQSHPGTFPSMYQTSVIGQLAHSHNEPAVLYSLVSGQPVVGSQGVSQEGVFVQQNVIPVLSDSGKVIGALIMEQDITERVTQEKNVQRLMETNEQLSQTLLSVALSEGSMQELMHEGIILFDGQGLVTYTNPQAEGMLSRIGYQGVMEGVDIAALFHGRLDLGEVLRVQGVVSKELRFDQATIVLKAVLIYRSQQVVGGLMLVRDITDLIVKDKQLLMKSAVIKEIHHRVKNNLQTISSLLRLQMRRTKLPEVERVYRDSINRINSIAVIHEMLAYEGADSIPFQDVADRIVKNVISSTARPDQKIRASITGMELELASEQATTLALVVNELIQNSVLHAYAHRESGDIRIQLAVADHEAILEVADDGIGMAASKLESTLTDLADSTEDKRSHLGLKIVEMLIVENLNGELAFHSDSNGTRINISFPLSSGLLKEDE
jgi:two-component sensor histidine kinase